MALFDGIPVGVNLGGWLSQYPAYDHRYFETFITAADIRQIAGWGMDHIRLPVDYPVLEDEAQPGRYLESGFAHLEQCLEWCQAEGLGVILDLHKAPGYSFDAPQRAAANTLFSSPELRARFVAMWEMLARRYAGKWPGLVFELLNEVVLPASDPWNKLAHRTVAAVRAIDAVRPIVIGSNRYSAVSTLTDLELFPDDSNIIYTFHFYEPLLFTHQKAWWAPPARDFDRTLTYPGEVPGLGDFIAQHPEHKPMLAEVAGHRMDQGLLRRLLQPALAFRARAGRPLYCGEYGVFEQVAWPDRLNWHRDFVALLREYGLGRAVWTYKQLDFGLVDNASRVLNDALVKIVSAR